MRSEEKQSSKDCATPCSCGEKCIYDDEQDERGPCWGRVSAIAEETSDDDWWWIHACEGHETVYEGGSYKSHSELSQSKES